MRNFQKLVAVIALSGLCFAVPAPSDSGAPKKHAAKVVKKDMTAEQLKELKQQMDQQQAATQQLQEQLKQTQQQLQQTQQQLSQAQATANAANAKVATVETNTTMQVQKVQSDLTDVKTALNTTDMEAKKAVKEVGELQHPNSIAYKGIRITPGGFLEETEYWRSHATLSDQATPFNSIPLGGFAGGSATGNTATQSAYNPYLTEYGMTARDTRITLRADADAGTTKLTGYYEMDFFGTSPTANLSQTTSYTPRIRQGWGRAKFANGWTITGGQMWSLITLNRKGVDSDNSNLWIPNIIEAQYSVGYDWARFAEVRIGKQITKNLSFALALDNPAYLNTGATNTTGTVAGLASLGNGLLGNSLVSSCSAVTSGTPAVVTGVICTNTPTYSTNLAPDTIVKLAYDDPKLGHWEIKGISRFFRDRAVSTVVGTFPTAVVTPGWNNTALGGGIGAGTIIPVVPGKIDFVAQGMWGKGISRYEDSGQYDFVVKSTPDHNMIPLKSFSVLTGFETHPNKKTELDLLFGDEYYYRDVYTTTAGTPAGYGAPNANNTACGFESAAVGTAVGAGDACAGNNKNLWNAKLYGYYDLYKGPVGTLRFGAEVDYVERQVWSGNGGLTAGSAGIGAKGNEKTAFTTMRYIFP
jgi:TolA-binding protein